MIIDIRKLNAKKEYRGTLEFEYEPSDELIDIPFVKFKGKAKVIAKYELFEDDSFELIGKIIYRIEGQCSRCMEEASQEVEGEIDAYFQPFKDSEDYSYTNGMINLSEALDDAIMMSMPHVLLCREDCPGIKY